MQIPLQITLCLSFTQSGDKSISWNHYNNSDHSSPTISTFSDPYLDDCNNIPINFYGTKVSYLILSAWFSQQGFYYIVSILKHFCFLYII